VKTQTEKKMFVQETRTHNTKKRKRRINYSEDAGTKKVVHPRLRLVARVAGITTESQYIAFFKNSIEKIILENGEQAFVRGMLRVRQVTGITSALDWRLLMNRHVARALVENSTSFVMNLERIQAMTKFKGAADWRRFMSTSMGNLIANDIDNLLKSLAAIGEIAKLNTALEWRKFMNSSVSSAIATDVNTLLDGMRRVGEITSLKTSLDWRSVISAGMVSAIGRDVNGIVAAITRVQKLTKICDRADWRSFLTSGVAAVMSHNIDDFMIGMLRMQREFHLVNANQWKIVMNDGTARALQHIRQHDNWFKRMRYFGDLLKLQQDEWTHVSCRSLSWSTLYWPEETQHRLKYVLDAIGAETVVAMIRRNRQGFCGRALMCEDGAYDFLDAVIVVNNACQHCCYNVTKTMANLMRTVTSINNMIKYAEAIRNVRHKPTSSEYIDVVDGFLSGFRA